MNLEQMAEDARAYLTLNGLLPTQASVELYNDGSRQTLDVTAVARTRTSSVFGQTIWQLSVSTGYTTEVDRRTVAPEVKFNGQLTPIAVGLIVTLQERLPANRASETIRAISSPDWE